MIDIDVLWMLLNRIFVFLRAPLSIYFIFFYLTPVEQGLWYTFGSLSAIKILIELGFTEITSQFVSHESAGLKFLKNKLVGEAYRLNRLFGFINFSIRIYFYLVPVSIIILSFVGYYYFKNEASFVLNAWILYAIINSFNLLLSVFQSVYLGLNKVKQIQKNIFIVNFTQVIFSWLFLFFGFGIFSLPFSGLISLIIGFIVLFQISKPLWLQFIENKPLKNISYFREILPFQIRFSLSSVSAYLSGFLIIPVTYKYLGQIYAGQFGVTLSVFSLLTSLPIVLITSKMPTLGMMVANNKVQEVYLLFRKNFKKGIYLFMIISFILLISFLGLQWMSYGFMDRFLPFRYIPFLIIPNLINFILSSYTYLFRAFKKEQLVLVWLLQSIFIVFGLFFLLPLGIMTFLIYQNIFSLIFLLPIIIIYSNIKINRFLIKI
jgi:O-antigen/teichoic acid export membrane protein